MVKLAFSNKYLYALPEGHRFPIQKYELVKKQLVYEGTIEEGQVYDPGLVEEERVLRVHTREYWNSLQSQLLDKKALRKIGLPLTETTLLRARNSVAGTVKSAHIALKEGVGVNLAGGTHHAYADRGEGFCVLNDIAISAYDLLDAQLVKKILIIDLDVHQGNGSAKIFENESRVFTFSMHGENNYPLHKEKSDLDIPLPLNTDDNFYLTVLDDALPGLFDKAKPDIVYYQAGVDVIASDMLGKLGLTKKGARLRDEMVIHICQKNNVPLVVTMGGGYAKKLTDLVDAHSNTFRAVIAAY